jgi:hypothetical protein
MNNNHAHEFVKICLAVILLEVFIFGFKPVEAAESGPRIGYALTKGTNEFGFWTGGSPTSFGNIEDRQLFLFALRYGRVLATWDRVALEYTLDVFPAAIVFEPREARHGRSTIYGAGLSPLGFKVSFAPHSRIQPFVAASVGFLYFTEDVPLPHSSQFNFTPEIGLGLQLFVAPKRALTLGYKLHHISNAGTGERNPGLNSHVIYAVFPFLHREVLIPWRP